MSESAGRFVEFDEVRSIALPPPQTAAVNRLLREEEGWLLLDARVSEHPVAQDDGVGARHEPMVVYVLAHRAEERG